MFNIGDKVRLTSKVKEIFDDSWCVDDTLTIYNIINHGTITIYLIKLKLKEDGFTRTCSFHLNDLIPYVQYNFKQIVDELNRIEVLLNDKP